MFGLDVIEESVYRRLLRSSGQRPGELARALGRSEPDTRVAVARLLSLSLVRWSAEDPEVLLPINPEVSLGSLLADQEARLGRLQDDVLRNRAHLAELVSEHSDAGAARGDGGVERVQGQEAVRAHVEGLLRQCGGEVVSFNPDTDTSALLSTVRITEQAIVERGMPVRTIYLDSVRNHPPSRDHLRRLAESDAQVRLAPVLPLPLLLFDAKAALLPMDPGFSGVGALVITGQALLLALMALFERHWEAASPLNETVVPVAATQELTSGETELLRLLSKGLTDEAVGRQFGVSQRTIRRRIAGLTERLDAGSRFQAGVLASRRGWV